MGKVAQFGHTVPKEKATSDFNVALYLESLPSLIQADSLQQVISKAVHFYLQSNPGFKSNGNLAIELSAHLSTEREEISGPAQRLLSKISGNQSLSLDSNLQQIATTYVESTQYLFPFLFAFGKAVKAVCDLNGTSLQPTLVLRDGLIFWPALFALNQNNPLHYLLFSRTHLENEAAPKLFVEKDGRIKETVGFLSASSLLVDVGLYGSLVSHLIKDGWCEKKVATLFFASRNPFICGWLNLHAGSQIVGGKIQFDLLDIIRLADSAESLLKPFRITSGQESRTREVFSDITSFVCSTALLWAAYKYCAETVRTGSEMTLGDLANTKTNPSSWFLREPIARWEHADRFLANWQHGPLFPQCQLSGFKV